VLKSGLFSVIVTVFITESYKKLSPNSGDQTVALLTQLVNSSARAPAALQNSPPFKTPASIVRVNVFWFLSLILSLSCALLATLMQQWARRYLEYAQHHSAPRKRARIRAYMFEGVEKFRLSGVVEALPLLLHTSVFLFFAGLIDFLFPINNVVARYALSCIVVFASIYAILTVLPSLRLNCPYHTPLSGITYTSIQLFTLCVFWITNTTEGVFHESLLLMWRWSHPNMRGPPNQGPTKWRETLENKVRTHYERVSHGLRWTIMRSAMEAPPSVDASALRWTLTRLEEDKELEDLIARMPGFFDSSAPPDATSAMLSIMSEQPTSEPILGIRLHELLFTCLPGTSILSEEQRKRRLRVCLTSLWYCVRAYNLPKNLEAPLPPYVRAVFANSQVIRWIQTERDFSIRLLGRCFGSLVVEKVANDIASPTRTPTTAEIACLKSILDATGEQVWSWLDHRGSIDLANLISLTSSEIETLVDNGTKGVSADILDVFQQTLHIVAEGMFSKHATDWDTDQVAHFQGLYSMFMKAPVPGVLKERLQYISDKLPMSPLQEPEMVMPVPELFSETFPRAGPSRQIRIGGAPDSGFGDISS
jgi:hypothetical protein